MNGDMERYKKDFDKSEITLERNKRMSLYKSKYSLSEAVTEILGSLRSDISKYAAKLESGIATTPDIKTLLGLLNETWAHIQHMNGTLVSLKIKKYKKSCRKLILNYGHRAIPEKELPKILNYRDYLYKILAFNNLSIEIESKRTSNKLKERIIG